MAFYLRWQLSDVPDEDAVSEFAMGCAARNACSFDPGAAPAPSSARGVALEPELPRGPGVYFADAREPGAAKGDAVIRGQLLAERIISGRFHARRAVRRGKKGALDVIVVGANAVGVSATLRLMEAGLRVLLVDREGDQPLAQSSRQALLRALRCDPQTTRLPLLVGHDVSAVSERADGMLEVQAERAGWYAANVIFASLDSLATPPAVRTGAHAGTPPAPRVDRTPASAGRRPPAQEGNSASHAA